MINSPYIKHMRRETIWQISFVCPTLIINLLEIQYVRVNMKIRGISRDLLELLLKIGRDRHPFEFAGILREKDGVIDEFNLLPGTVSSESSASLFLDMMPLDTHVAGSAHSHPNGALVPSDADLSFFPRVGRYHLIIGYPYTEESWRCFSANGNPAEMEVIG